MNNRSYERIAVDTSLGKTQVHGLNSPSTNLPAIVIFPGFRTTSLIWDLDNGLDEMARHLRIFLVETNGQPNLSEGNSPSIKSLNYGHWGKEVFDALSIDEGFIAGASFGGLVCMKIALVIPDRIKAAFLLNPGCFRSISFGLKNLYYNILPILSPSRKNIQKFLDAVIFDKPRHQLSEQAEQHLLDYLEYVLRHYKDHTEKPYYMNKQLDKVAVDTHLFLGKADLLIPYEKSQRRAEQHLGESLKTIWLTDAGHGIETHRESLDKICEIARSTSPG